MSTHAGLYDPRYALTERTVREYSRVPLGVLHGVLLERPIEYPMEYPIEYPCEEYRAGDGGFERVQGRFNPMEYPCEYPLSTPWSTRVSTPVSTRVSTV